MTTPNHPTGQPPTAWQRHHQATETAMRAYLAVTYAAHRQYLTGPWPDRDAYNAVELSAWVTYHAACRAAWATYRAETTAPPPPPVPTGPTFTPSDPAGTPNEFDQRQENYPAADPNRRDNH